MDTKPNRETVELAVIGDDGSDGQSLKCSFEIPAGWSLTRASSDRVLLFPGGIEAYARDEFAPNVVMALEAGQPTPSDGPRVVISSTCSEGDDGDARTTEVTADLLDGQTLLALVDQQSVTDWRVSTVCSALDTQWESVAREFDLLVDSVSISEGAGQGKS